MFAIVRRVSLFILAACLAAGLALTACGSTPFSSTRFSGAVSSSSTSTDVTTSTTTTSSTTSSTTTTIPTFTQGLACGSALPFYGATTMTTGPVNSTVVEGPITASLSGTLGSDLVLSDPRLVISWAERSLLDETVVPPQFQGVPSGGHVMPWPIVTSADASQDQALCIARVVSSSTPVVLIGFDSGGVHCCDALRAIAVTPTAAEEAVDLEAGNPGVELKEVGGQVLIVTGDNAFAYAFSSYAGSGMPIAIYGFDNNRFLNITKEYPSLIEADASKWWNGWSAPQNDQGGLGLLAAWAADQCNLGECSQAFATVNQLNDQGRLTGPDGWPTGSAYVSELRSFLIKNGYTQ